MLKSDRYEAANTTPLLPRHDEIYWPRRLLEAVWISTALILIGYHFVSLTLSLDLRRPWILLLVLAGFQRFEVIHLAFEDEVGIDPVFIDLDGAHDVLCAFGVVPKFGIVTQFFEIA